MEAKHLQIISDQLSISFNKVKNTANLLAEGATIPFLARYRKEATGSLDEVQITEIKTQINKLEELEKRRASILNAIEEQGKLTDELRQKIQSTYHPTELEDLYLPYKKKRKTRASVAKEKGLEPLAKTIFEQRNQNIESIAASFLNDEVNTIEEALQGARDIIAEWINEDEKARNEVRYSYKTGATIRSKVARGKNDEGAKYGDYFDFEEPLKKCPSHRLLAIRRGEEEGILRVSISPDEENTIYHLEKHFLQGYGKSTDLVKEALSDSYKRLLFSID